MVVLDLKFAGIDIRPGKVVQPRIFHVEDAAALHANEVVMMFELRIEARGRACVRGLGHQAERNKGAEDAVDSHEGDLGELATHQSIKLLSRWMVIPPQDRFKNGAALRCNRQASFAMGGKEGVHSLFFVGRLHRFGNAYWNQMIIICK